ADRLAAERADRPRARGAGSNAPTVVPGQPGRHETALASMARRRRRIPARLAHEAGRLGELRGSLLAHGGDSLTDVGTRHVEELELERGVEDRPGPNEPLVERHLRVRDRGLRSGREPSRDLERPLLELVLGHAERDETDALRLGAVDLLAQEQVVLRLRHPAQERPDDRRVIAGGDAADEDGPRLLVLPDRLPDARELAVLRLAHCVEPPGRAERQPQDPVLRPVEVERGKLLLVRIRRHEADPTARRYARPEADAG